RRPVGTDHHGPGLDSLQYSSIAVVVGWQKTPLQALAPPYTSAYFSYNCLLSNVLIEGFGIPLPSSVGLDLSWASSSSPISSMISWSVSTLLTFSIPNR